MTDKIDSLIAGLPGFLRDSVDAYTPLIRRLPEQELFALVDLIEQDSPDSIQKAAEVLAQLSTLGELAAAKTVLTRMTQRMADDRQLTRQVARDVMRASIRHAIRLAVS
jgi:hypothetical protein